MVEKRKSMSFQSSKSVIGDTKDKLGMSVSIAKRAMTSLREIIEKAERATADTYNASLPLWKDGIMAGYESLNKFAFHTAYANMYATEILQKYSTLQQQPLREMPPPSTPKTWQVKKNGSN